MMGTNNTAWVFKGFELHMIFGTAFLIGAILFVVWATRALNKKELGTWTLWLLVIGIIGMILTAGWGMGAMSSMMHGGGKANIEANIESMAKHMSEEDHSELKTSEQWQEHMMKEMGEHMFGE